jgi:hypothetical protein
MKVADEGWFIESVVGLELFHLFFRDGLLLAAEAACGGARARADALHFHEGAFDGPSWNHSGDKKHKNGDPE